MEQKKESEQPDTLQQTKENIKEQLLQIKTNPKEEPSEHHNKHTHTAEHSHTKQHITKKPIHKNPYFYLSLGILLILIIGVVAYLSLQNNKNVVVTVNGEAITADAVAKEISILPPQYTAIMGKEQLEKTITEQLIFKKLLLQEAKKKNIQVTEEEVNKALSDFLTATAMTAQQFEQKLAEQKASVNEIKLLYKEQLLINKVLTQEAFTTISVSEEKLRQYYDANTNDLVQLRASHILLCYNSSLFCQQNRSEAETKAMAAGVLQKIIAGESFAELAQQYSDDPSAKRGGDLGWFGKGDMVLPFEEAAFKLGTNQVSELVKTQFGYHIIKLTARNESFTDLKAIIEQQLSAEQKQTAVKEYLDKLKSAADVRYKN